jgi:hypothetical protein
MANASPKTAPDAPAWGGWLLTLAAVALLIFGLWHLGFSFTKFLIGLGSLGNFVVLMFPPDWGDNTSLWRYTKALGETVAIAPGGRPIGIVPLAPPVPERVTVLAAADRDQTSSSSSSRCWPSAGFGIAAAGGCSPATSWGSPTKTP